MLGKLRRCFLIPTEIMSADVLTKLMISPQLMNLLTTGFLFMKCKKTVKMRVRLKNTEYTEQDFVEMDH